MLKCVFRIMKDSTQLISGMDVISGTAPTRPRKSPVWSLLAGSKQSSWDPPQESCHSVSRYEPGFWKTLRNFPTAPTIGTILLTTVLAISLNMDVGVKCWGPNDPISVKVGEGPWRFPTKVLRSPMSVVEHILGMSFWKGLSHKHKEYDV